MTLSIFKSKRGGLIGFVAFATLFLLFWIFVLSSFLTTAGTMAAADATGFEKWFYMNLNFVTFIGFLLFVIIGGYLST